MQAEAARQNMLLESWGEVLSTRVISETYQAYQAPYSCGPNDQ